MTKQKQLIGWGISCTVKSDQEMGTVTAALTLLKARNIAWEPLYADVNSVQRKQGVKSIDVCEAFLKNATQFKPKELGQALEASGFKRSSAYPILQYYLKNKRVKRVKPGVYQNIKAAA